MKNLIKALRLKPKKDYVVVVKKGEIRPQDFVATKYIKMGFIVNDINNITLHELDEFEAWIRNKRMSLNSQSE